LDAELLETTVEAFVRSCAELSQEQPASLLLLEVDQLPEEAQASLLGFLKISELQLHTLATAREPPLVRAANGQFRRELAHVLSTLVIEIPPLGERVEDVPLLAQAAVEQGNARGERQVAGLTEKAMNCLLRYEWPGNADELYQLVGEAHRAASGPYITDQDLPERIPLSLAAAEHPPLEATSIDLDRYLADIERELIQRSLHVAKGNRAGAARSLGISRARLLRRMEALGIS
jgi:DNA-binding NtrC family response regulator